MSRTQLLDERSTPLTSSNADLNVGSRMTRIDQAAPRGFEPESIELPGVGRTFQIKIASARWEFDGAFRLLSERYQAKGYEDTGLHPYRFTPYHVLPQTITAVATVGHEVLATLSMVPDTALLGLPMDCIYREELDGLRLQGCRTGEVSSLAEDGLGTREFIVVFNTMIRLVIQYLMRIGGDTCVIAVNPRHSRYYQRTFGFEKFGGLRYYPSVCNAPAEAFLCTLRHLADVAPAFLDKLVGEPLSEKSLKPGQLDENHYRYFSERSSCASPDEFSRILSHRLSDRAHPFWITKSNAHKRIFKQRIAGIRASSA